MYLCLPVCIRMCVCIYTHMHGYLCMYVHVCAHTYVYVCVCRENMCICVHAHICTSMYVCMRTCVCACVHVCRCIVCMCAYLYACVCAPVRIRLNQTKIDFSGEASVQETQGGQRWQPGHRSASRSQHGASDRNEAKPIHDPGRDQGERGTPGGARWLTVERQGDSFRKMRCTGSPLSLRAPPHRRPPLPRRRMSRSALGSPPRGTPGRVDGELGFQAPHGCVPPFESSLNFSIPRGLIQGTKINKQTKNENAERTAVPPGVSGEPV